MENPQVPISETVPLKGCDERQTTAEDDQYEETVTFYGCGCFRNFFESRWGRYSDTHGDVHDGRRENWVMRKVKDLKEMSEKIAGPKWKNFIRGISNKKIRRNLQFQYDSRSYSLNFDEGPDVSYPDFPARFPAPVLNNSIVSAVL